MKSTLIVVFCGIVGAMLYVTITASFERGVFEAATALWPDPWFRATLADAYFGFLTFSIWVAYKERTLTARFVWFVLIMALGNIAMAIYVLIKLAQLKPNQPLEALLLRRGS